MRQDPANRPLSRRGLLRAAAALPLAAPLVRRALAADGARIALLHMNDFHSKHEGVAEGGSVCREGRPCAGGSARLAGAIREARAAAIAEGRAPFLLDAGDQFMGSLFYTQHRGLAEAAVQRAMGTMAMSLGNHEFDNGPANLARYAAAVPFPLLSANLDASREPLLRDRVSGFAVLESHGARIGVVGLTTQETATSSSPGPNLRFTDPFEAAERAAFALRRQGIGTVVVLSHLGLSLDRRLAAEVEGVDAIIGGHSHLLLANGLAGAVGPHPLVVQGRGRDVRIGQVACHARYLGRMDLDLGADGRVASHGGGVRPIGPDVPEDPAVAAVVAEYAAPLGEIRRRALAVAEGFFPNEPCREGECALGSLVADAALARVPSAEIAIVNGGGMRAALPSGTVTYGDVLAVLPFGNTLATLTIRGGAIRAALENGLSRLPRDAGRFPQVAGLRLRFDPAAPVGQRVREVRMADWTPLDPDRAYRVVTISFMRAGGDGYAVLRDEALEAYDEGPPMEEVVADHLAARGRVAPVMDGRMARD
ncbi:5'-nucleotidase C-terminal domain-containing protein [Roseomonas sp. SSH11]|uniref:5'-nucleotidase C-terminal domain-containing protein n=1 Tax=Pararoseomonas baculiformis TaxID=2820812 RepID=A0ABS4AFY9_9PROT|nr:5'-nucleotidase C-terminal domain-containing protein [Pararoseomonas baculiformis]MBP0445435.1 5'-nucleotidase C-terminal domain-containing protein [Pararoseomonas baculiformis]